MMKTTWLSLGSLTLATSILAQSPATDPLSVVQRPRGADTEAHLSPSTQPYASPHLDDAIKRGLTFLKDWQSPNGSWDRLENSDAMLSPDPHIPPPSLKPKDFGKLWHSGPYDGPVKDLAESKDDVEHLADTCLSTAAMLKAIGSGRQPELAKSCSKAIDYVCKQVDLWNADTILIQKRFLDPIHDSSSDVFRRPDLPVHPDSLEGLYYDPTVDTFFALRMLSEAKTRVTEPVLAAKIEKAIAILVRKIERSQDRSGKPDRTGTWLDETTPVLFIAHPPTFATHCVAISSFSVAVRNGVTIKPEVLALAIKYFAKEPPQDRRELIYDQKHLILATRYDLYLMRCYQLDQAKKPRSGQSTATLKQLEQQLEAERTALQKQIAILVTEKIRCRGAALDCLPSLILAVREFAPAEAPAFENKLTLALLSRQQHDGHFIAGTGTWGRGDNTFGTSTTLPTLILLADRKKLP